MHASPIYQQGQRNHYLRACKIGAHGNGEVRGLTGADKILTCASKAPYFPIPMCPHPTCAAKPLVTKPVWPLPAPVGGQ